MNGGREATSCVNPGAGLTSPRNQDKSSSIVLGLGIVYVVLEGASVPLN